MPPTGQSLFFASPKKRNQKFAKRECAHLAKPSYARAKGNPTEAVRLGPDCSAVLVVWGLAPNSLRGLRPLRSNNRAKSVHEARYRARPQTPALLDASHG